MPTRAQLHRRRSLLARAWDLLIPAICDNRPVSAEHAGVRTEIVASWERSAAHIPPEVSEAPLADADETRAAWRGSPLSAAVRRLEAQLQAAADDGELVVAVTDPAARILWTHGGAVMRRRAEQVNFVPGGRWDEASVGTNALDLALRLDRAAMVYSAEHFSSCVHGWVCWAAPVHDPGTGRQLGVLDLSTTWDRSHPIGLAAAEALARLLSREARQAIPAAVDRHDTGVCGGLLELRLLGRASAHLNGGRLRLTRRQTEILALLALNPDGLDLGDLHARLYGDRPVSLGTLKAEMSQLRAVLGGHLESRPYRIGLEVRCDVTDVLRRLRARDVAGAVERYGGELLPGTESPALAEFGNFVTVALRNALLADPQPAAVQRYLELAPYDLDLLDGIRRRQPTVGQPRGAYAERLLRRDDMTHTAVPAQACSLPPRQSATARIVRRGRSHAAEDERHRLARELHDGAIQEVLAAGLAIDECLADVPAGSPAQVNLEHAKRLTAAALRRLRSSLQTLRDGAGARDEELPDMLRRLLDGHPAHQLDMSVEVIGTPVPLAAAVRRALLQVAGECLFNASVHGRARRAVIRLSYGRGAVALSVADDGRGKPKTLRKIIRGEVPGTGCGYHYGLADIAARAEEMGWALRADRSDLGGVAVQVLLPAGSPDDRQGETGA
jgi:signal transduction histidine kinase